MTHDNEEENLLMEQMGFSAFGDRRRKRKRPQKKAEVLKMRTRACNLPQVIDITGNRASKVKEISSRLSSRMELDNDILYLINSPLSELLLHSTKLHEKNTGSYFSNDNQALLMQLSHEKERFNNLNPKVFTTARSSMNLYETLGRAFFINRSAMKMVNLDHIFQLVDPKAIDSLVFADLCGGPGGFSQYLLWRYPQCQGYGISLRDDVHSCGWQAKLQKHPRFIISYGEDGTGNLYRLENIQEFIQRIEGQHVALVVSDGGFVEARDQINQEVLLQRLILCEIYTMLQILQPKGHFVCKCFELTERLSLELVYLLHFCFEKVTIVKPITSRPASSERYLVCLNLKGTNSQLATFKARIEELIQSFSCESSDHRNLFSFDILRQDPAFLEYIQFLNDSLGKAQIKACQDISAFAADPTDFNSIKQVNRQEYYTLWRLNNR